MLRAALGTGAVDLILSPEEIAAELYGIGLHGSLTGAGLTDVPPGTEKAGGNIPEKSGGCAD
jgi:hypothetical protein